LKHRLVKGIKLSKIRIVDKSTVYVIGLAPSLIDHQVIRRFEYFGQYGQIQKVLIKTREFISKKESDSDSTKLPSFAAHITYATPEEASLAILALDKHVFDGRKIRASFGRTKFCKFFLQSIACQQRDECPYLHKDVKECDILTPDD
jgi:CCR4-NOT transcription complex subunit 4